MSTEEDVSMTSPIVTTATEAPKAEEKKGLTEEEEERERRDAVKQIEFYFADSNLPYDKFMWTLHSKDSIHHWVPLSTVASFKRMRRFLPKPELGHDLKWLASSVKEFSSALEVDDGEEVNVRRKAEVVPPKSQFERSVYAKGFPIEDPTGDLQMRLEEFFTRYANTNAVRMRRYDDDSKAFKGSVFVEFTEPEGVQSFLNADPKPSWDGKELVVMTKEEYCDMKIKEKGLSGKGAAIRKENMVNKKGGFNAFRLGAETNGKSGIKAPLKEIYLDFMGSKLLITRDAESGEGKVNEEEIPFVSGTTLKFVVAEEGKEEAWKEDGVRFLDIKNATKPIFESRAPFIKYTNKGDTSGLLGFHRVVSDEEKSKVEEALKEIGGVKVKWERVGEEEEREFQKERAISAAKAIVKKESEEGNGREHSGGGRGRGGRGGRGGDRGRGGRGRGGRGRGGARGGDRNAEREADTGEKRKRAVEPDGGPHTGQRGTDTAAPPAIMITTNKKVKVDGAES